MKHHWRYEKILTPSKTKEKADSLKRDEKKLVTVNGSFDLLHAGHLDFLEEAHQQGDVLFIGLNSDASVAEGKGEGRPIIGEQERAAMLAALACVDFVVIIDKPYNEVQDEILHLVAPDVHVNGAEYGPVEEWREWSVMQEVGASGHGVERRPNLATSDIVEKIKNL